MQENKKINLAWNASALILIAIIVYCDYLLYMGNTPGYEGNTPGRYAGFTTFILFFLFTISPFLCSILLQAEDLVTVVQNRKTIKVRWELVGLGIVAFVLGFEKLFYYWISPPDAVISEPFSFALMSYSVFLYGWIDMLFMFASGIFFIQAFQGNEILQLERSRKRTFVVSALFLPGFVVARYLCVLAFIGMSELPRNPLLLEIMTVLLVLLNSAVMLASAAALQWEKVWILLQNRKNLQIEKKAMALCIIAILLVFIPMLLEYYIYDSPWGMMQAINLMPLWTFAYLFAACVFFLREFRIR